MELSGKYVNGPFHNLGESSTPTRLERGPMLPDRRNRADDSDGRNSEEADSVYIEII